MRTMSSVRTTASKRIIRICAAVLAAGFVAMPSAQAAPQESNTTQGAPTPAPVFRTNSRLVVVDVVALDSHGVPVPGLKEGDFNVREDGKAQHVVSFEEHRPANGPDAPVRHFHLPPHQYTNVPEQEFAGPLTVLLFDTLNTPAQDQQLARLHMLNFLKGLPPGRRVALFALGTKLRMIQTFTGDTDALIAAATNLISSPSSLLTRENDRQQREDNIAYRERMMAPSMSGGAGSGSRSSQSMAAAGNPIPSQKLREVFADQDNSSAEKRVGATLQAFAALAQMLGGYGGRKNLIWVSGGFPFSIGPDPFAHSDHAHIEHFELPIREITNLLSTAQVAVYPIDVGGVQSQGIVLSSNGEGSLGVDATSGTPRMNTTMMRQLAESSDKHGIMNDIANETGGQAFYGNNDLRAAMQHSMEQGSMYYTLAYSPDNQNWNGKFRRIEVNLSKGGYHLQYRRGYFALEEPEHTTNDSSAKLVGALRPDIPNATSLYLKAEILPPDAEHPQVRVRCLIDPVQVTFADTSTGGRHAIVDLLTVVWDKNGKDIGHTAQTFEGNLNDAEYHKVLHSGLQVNEDLAVNGEPFRVRLGAVDRASQRVGTLDVTFDK